MKQHDRYFKGKTPDIQPELSAANVTRTRIDTSVILQQNNERR